MRARQGVPLSFAASLPTSPRLFISGVADIFFAQGIASFISIIPYT